MDVASVGSGAVARLELLVDQGLVADMPQPRLLAKLFEHAWIDTDRDELTR